MEIKMIVAIGKDGAIGCEGKLIWKIPDDLKRFKSLTMGHPVIMGRKTWESLPKKPLPGRKNIILTHKKDYKAEGAEIAASPEQALCLINDESPFIIGGAEIYKQFMPLASYLYLTEVDDDCPAADTFLNIDYDKDWEKIEESNVATTNEGVSYRYVTLKRKS